MSKVTITLDALMTSNFSTLFGKAKNYIKGFKDSINSSMFATLGAAQMAGKAIGYVSGTLSQVMAEAKQFEKTGIKFGVNPSEVAKLGKMAEETMTPVRSLYKGLNQLKGAAAQALADPKSDMANAFRQLGVTNGDLQQGLTNSNYLLGVVSDRLNEIGDDAQRQQAIQEVFKANGFALAGVLEMTSEEQKKLVEGHTTMNDLVIAQNSAMEDSWGKFWDSIKVGFSFIGLVLNPIVQVLSIILNIIQMLIVAVSGGLWASLQLVGGVLIAIGGVLGIIIGGILKFIGLIAKLMGMGDGISKFADNWLEVSAALTKGGIEQGVDAAGKTMRGTSDLLQGDVQDIKNAGGNLTAGYSDQTKSKREGTRKFKDPAEIKKEVEEEYKKKKEKEEEVAKKKKEEDKAKKELDNEKFKQSLQSSGLDENAQRQKEIEREINQRRDAGYALEGAARIDNEREMLKLQGEAHRLRLKQIEEAKKKEIEARREIAKGTLSLMGAVEEIGQKMKYDGMRRAGKSESEIANAQFADELSKAERMKAEYDALLAKQGGKQTAESLAMGEEVVKQQDKVVSTYRDSQSAGMQNMGVMADQMRRIGGGGTAVSTGNNSVLEVNKKQLASIEKMEAGITALVELVRTKGGLAATETGRKMQIDALALGSDNKPTK
jgi:hypothetical protein